MCVALDICPQPFAPVRACERARLRSDVGCPHDDAATMMARDATRGHRAVVVVVGEAVQHHAACICTPVIFPVKVLDLPTALTVCNIMDQLTAVALATQSLHRAFGSESEAWATDVCADQQSPPPCGCG